MKEKLNKLNTYLRKKCGLGLAKFPYRTSIDFIKKKFGTEGLVGAEIGVNKGENSEYILNKLNINKLYLIDPWEEYAEYDAKHRTSANLTHAFKETLKRINPYKDRVVILRKFSSEAMNDINEPLDFVYIDGNHEYEYVKSDIEKYYKKLKKGGVSAGHDISWPGVSKAFCEFVVKNKLQPNIKYMDWWMVKK